MNRVVWDAILGLRTLRFVYRGGARTVEPHCYGVGSDERELLRAYQVAGYSASGQPPGWRTFEISEMKDIEPGSQFSGPRPGYRRDDPTIARIIAQL
jgi:hypothetical protein